MTHGALLWYIAHHGPPLEGEYYEKVSARSSECVCPFAFAVAQQCVDCRHNQFGEAYCNPNISSCGCGCTAINIGQTHVCGLCGVCSLDKCLIDCENKKNLNESLVSDQKLAKLVAGHPWIMDTTAADKIRVYSNAMAVVFEQVQRLIKDKHWTNSRGWMSTTKDVPSDANGWVTFELISRDDGVSDIRLTYEKSRQQERLLVTSTKWLLNRVVPDADHILHEETVATGDITVPEIKP